MGNREVSCPTGQLTWAGSGASWPWRWSPPTLDRSTRTQRKTWVRINSINHLTWRRFTEDWNVTKVNKQDWNKGIRMELTLCGLYTLFSPTVLCTAQNLVCCAYNHHLSRINYMPSMRAYSLTKHNSPLGIIMCLWSFSQVLHVQTSEHFHCLTCMLASVCLLLHPHGKRSTEGGEDARIKIWVLQIKWWGGKTVRWPATESK